MGIRFSCPSGHKLNVKTFLAGKRGVCPQCGATFVIPNPADSPVAETIPPASIAQSQTVEVLAPPPNYTSTLAASPSIIIAVADTKASPPRAQTERAPQQSLNKV